MHSAAFGLGIKTKSLDKFIDWFNKQTADLNFAENTYQVNFEFDAYNSTDLQDICFELAEANRFWGGNNPQPVISLKNIHLKPGQINFMGSKQDTIKFNVQGVDCMIFRNSNIYQEWSKLNDEIVVDCIGRPSINEWMGRKSAQLMIDDFEWHINNVIDF